MLLDWTLLKKDWGAFLTVFAVWALYAYLTFEGPVNNASRELFSLSILEIRLLQLSVALPYLLIWLIITYGVLQMDRYRRSEKGELRASFGFITAGVAVLGTSTVVSPLIGALRTFLRLSTSDEVFKNLSIASNYVYIIFPLIAFVLMLYGIYRMGGRISIFNKENIFLVAILVLLIAGFYIPLVFTNESRNAPQSETTTATYYLSDPMIIATVIIPLLLTWAAAFFSVLSLNDISISRDSGLEKKGLRNLMFGLWFIIVSSMLLQSLLSLGGSRLLALGLGFILFLIYQFLVLEAVGYLFIASAARKFVKDKIAAI